jgi:hypothetical protein
VTDPNELWTGEHMVPKAETPIVLKRGSPTPKVGDLVEGKFEGAAARGFEGQVISFYGTVSFVYPTGNIMVRDSSGISLNVQVKRLYGRHVLKADSASK